MMRVTVGITTVDGDEISAAVEASGKYAPDVMHDLANRAREALKESWALQQQSAAGGGED